MRIGVYHLNQLGDLLFSLPFLASLKEANPDAQITSLLPAGLQPLTRHIPYIDGVIVRPKKKRSVWWKELRKNRFDWLISLSSSPSSYLTARSSLAPRRTGFKRPFFSNLLTESISHSGPFSLKASTNLRDHLSLPNVGDDYRGMIQFNSELENAEKGHWSEVDLPKVIVIAPGSSARRTAKRWPLEDVIKLIKYIPKEYQIFLTGTENEKSTLDYIRKASGNVAKNLAGDLSLPQLAYLLSKVRLVVCNDSGPLHLASVFETPTVALFGKTCPAETGPHNRNALVINAHRMSHISIDRVVEAVERQLA